MNSKVLAKFSEIQGYPFFESCGKPVDKAVVRVQDWKEALKQGNSGKWENCRLKARNALQRRIEDGYDGPLRERHWERMEEWNPLAEELQPQLEALIDKMLPNSPVPKHLVGKIRNELTWDFWFICLECNFQDIVEPPFHLPYLDPWYAAGYFPCGWAGEELPSDWGSTVDGGLLMVF